MRRTALKAALYGLVRGVAFSYTALDCTEDCFIQVGCVEQSSGTLRWTVLKAVLYRLVGEPFSGILRWTVLKSVLVQVGGWSSLHI